MCNKFVFSNPSDPYSIQTVRGELLQRLRGYQTAGGIKNYHIGTINIDPLTNRITTQIHVQPAFLDEAGIISIGARDLPSPEAEALVVHGPRDSRYEDRWEFIKEELEEEDEILVNKEEFKQENGSDSSINELQKYLSKNVSLVWKRLLR